MQEVHLADRLQGGPIHYVTCHILPIVNDCDLY